MRGIGRFIGGTRIAGKSGREANIFNPTMN